MMANHNKKKAFFFIALIISSFIFSSATDAQARNLKANRTAKTTKKQRVISSRTTSVPYSDLVIDAQSGRILWATNAEKARHPASLTKMMTLYLVFQALEAGKLRLEQRLPVSHFAASRSPSKLGLKPGQSIRVHDAIMGVVTKSANDAAVVLAEALGGSEENFARMMTRQARALGMKDTVFYNASGLPDPGQVTTARDMAILGYALVYHYPRFYGYFGKSSFTYAGQRHNNHNHLMERYDGMDGIKTGYVRASGFNLVASATRRGNRVIGVIFGGKSATSRDNRMAQLLDKSFDALENGAFQANLSVADCDQGDAGDSVDGRYLALPAKKAVIFPTDRQTSMAGGNIESTYVEYGGKASTSWGIQIGSYNDAGVGRRALEELKGAFPALLGRTESELRQETVAEGAHVYKARFVGMEQAAARSICAYMVKHGKGCFVVPPAQ